MKLKDVFVISDFALQQFEIFPGGSGKRSYSHRDDFVIRNICISVVDPRTKELGITVSVSFVSGYPALELFQNPKTYTPSVLTNLQHFVALSYPEACKLPTFTLDHAWSDSECAEFQKLLRIASDKLFSFNNLDSVMEEIRAKPGICFYHKFIKRWMFAVYDGKISASSMADFERLEQSLMEYNSAVKQNLGSRPEYEP